MLQHAVKKTDFFKEGTQKVFMAQCTRKGKAQSFSNVVIARGRRRRGFLSSSIASCVFFACLLLLKDRFATFVAENWPTISLYRD
jgi:hypothetical protein